MEKINPKKPKIVITKEAEEIQTKPTQDQYIKLRENMENIFLLTNKFIDK